MIPKLGQYVKVYFRNGMQTEGTISVWSKEESVILMPDGKSSCLIMNTSEDVCSVQMFHDMSETKIGLREHLTNLEEQFQETYEAPSEDDLRLKKLSDLKKLMVEQEKKIIKDKLVDHNISGAPKPEYEKIPSFLKRK